MEAPCAMPSPGIRVTPRTTRAAATVATAAATSRRERRGSAAAANASATRTTGRHNGAIGLSRRSQAAATTTSAGVETATVRPALRMRDLDCARALQRLRQVVPLPHDGDGNPGRLQPQQARLRPPRTAREARCVDVDEGDRAPGERALEQPADEGRLDPGGHHDEL